MKDRKIYTCSICGDVEPEAATWFLVSENCLEDKLQILHWNQRLAERVGVHAACSAGHVQELVVHWMTTGSLDYPFAQARSPNAGARRSPAFPTERPETQRSRPIGELAVDRESMRRVLAESPHSLRTILDALLKALQEPNLSLGTELETEAITGAAAREM